MGDDKSAYISGQPPMQQEILGLTVRSAGERDQREAVRPSMLQPRRLASQGNVGAEHQKRWNKSREEKGRGRRGEQQRAPFSTDRDKKKKGLNTAGWDIHEATGPRARQLYSPGALLQAPMEE